MIFSLGVCTNTSLNKRKSDHVEIFSFSCFATPLPSDSYRQNRGSEAQDIIAVALKESNQEGDRWGEGNNFLILFLTIWKIKDSFQSAEDPLELGIA